MTKIVPNLAKRERKRVNSLNRHLRRMEAKKQKAKADRVEAATDTYLLRWHRLQALGFATYADYLASDLWKRIRERAFRKHGPFCTLCGLPADLMHHLGYGRDALLGHDLTKLAPLCDVCHKEVEFTKAGKKRGLVNVHTTYRRLLKERRKKVHAERVARRGA